MMARIRTLRVLSTSRLGHRGSFLLCLGVFFLLYGTSQIWPSTEWLHRAETIWRSQIMDSQAFGTVWWTAGILCVLCAFARQDRIGFIAAVMLLLFWSFMSASAQIWGSAQRGYVSAGTWAAFAVCTMIMSGVTERPHVDTYTTVEEDESTTAFPTEQGSSRAV